MSSGNRTQSWASIRGRTWRRKVARLFRRRRPPHSSAVLFCTTNGAGIGHLTRALAVACALRALDPARPIIFLISTPDLSIVRRHNFPTYYLPYFGELEQDIGWESWNDYVRASALKVLDNHGVEVVVFDGYVPFFGLMDALDARRSISRLWIRRGMEKLGHTELPDEVETAFDFVIKPQEAGRVPQIFDGRVLEVDPIIACDPTSLPGRGEARRDLGIEDDELAVYVQLGSGVRFDNRQALEDIVDVLNDHSDIFVVLGMSTLANAVAPPIRNGRVLRHYPNHIYFKAFDFAVSAAGYNSFHELLVCQIPSIFVPREALQDTEDQAARAMLAQEAGAALMLHDCTDREEFRTRFRKLVDRMKSTGERQALATRAALLVAANGSVAAAKFVAGVGSAGGRGRQWKPGLEGAVVEIADIDTLRRIAENDEPELGIIGRLIRPGSVAIDVGGDIGLYTLAMADAGAYVKVLECRVEAARQLQRLFKDLPVEIHAVGASDRDRTDTLFVPMFSGKLVGSRASLDRRVNGNVYQVSCAIRLEPLDGFGFKDVSLIKIDVEGHEAAVLGGAAQTIVRNRPVLLIEIEERHHPGESAPLIESLNESGYRAWYLQGQTLHPATGFDFDRHQSPALAKLAAGKRHPAYINNFFFLPVEREQLLLQQMAPIMIADPF